MVRLDGCWRRAAHVHTTLLLLAACLGPAAAVLEPVKDQLHNLEQAQDTSGTASALPEIRFEREKELYEDPHAAMNAFLDRFEREQAQQQEQRQDLEGGQSGLLEQLIGSRQDNKCGINETTARSGRVARENLVVLPARDDFDASKWMTDPARANWDIIVLYLGQKPDYACPLCKAVYRATGPKWRLVWGFTLLPEYQQYRKNYSAIAFPDDDLVVDQCTLNTLFSMIKAYRLLAAQPSICDAHWSHTPWKILYQQPQNILRFTTMIEIMCPAFEMNYFDGFIRPSLYNAHVGWGLDFVWPFLLKYPRDKIAVIDEVCMFHPPSTPNKAESVYTAGAPYKRKEEETRRFAEYGYYESDCEKLGFYHMPVEVLGAVPRPAQREGLLGLLRGAGSQLQARLGPLYPLLLLAQTGVILMGCFLLVRSKLRGRGRRLFFRREQYVRLPLCDLVVEVAKKEAEDGGGSRPGAFIRAVRCS